MNRPVIDGERLLARIGELALVGKTAAGGVTRDSFSNEFVTARNLLADWFAEAGLVVSVDPVGNLFGRRPGRTDLPALVIGSHIDTVNNGGTLDGTYGILAGLATLEALDAGEITLQHPLVLAAFINEEGARGTPAMTGSRAVAGSLVAEDFDAHDDSERTVRELIASIGGEPENFVQAAWAPGSIAAYFELHVEQGPVLEYRKKSIGIVTGVTGRTLFDVAITGEAGHAGTMPMRGRRDALVASTHIITAIQALGNSGQTRVATTGAVKVEPGSRNTVPGHVVLEAEVRDDDGTRMELAIALLRKTCQDIAAALGVAIEVNVVDVVAPCPTDEVLQWNFEVAAAEYAVPSSKLTSSAGHDSQSFSGLCPIGILFVPSVGGVSHVPEEQTQPEDLISGAAVLAQALIHTDQRFVFSRSTSPS